MVEFGFDRIFREISVRAGREGLSGVLLGILEAERHHRHRLQHPVAPNPAQQLKAVRLRQMQIDQEYAG